MSVAAQPLPVHRTSFASRAWAFVRRHTITLFGLLALAYLVGAVAVLHVRRARWLIVAAALLIGHWALLMLVPFDGHPAGTVTPMEMVTAMPPTDTSSPESPKGMAIHPVV